MPLNDVSSMAPRPGAAARAGAKPLPPSSAEAENAMAMLAARRPPLQHAASDPLPGRHGGALRSACQATERAGRNPLNAPTADVLGATALRRLVNALGARREAGPLWLDAPPPERAARHLQLSFYLETIGSTTLCNPERLARAQARLRLGLRQLGDQAFSPGVGRTLWRHLLQGADDGETGDAAAPPSIDGLWLWTYLCGRDGRDGRDGGPTGRTLQRATSAIRLVEADLPQGRPLMVVVPPTASLAKLFARTRPALMASWPTASPLVAAEALLGQPGLLREWPWPPGFAGRAVQRAVVDEAEKVALAALGGPRDAVSLAVEEGLIVLRALLERHLLASLPSRALLPARVAAGLTDPTAALSRASGQPPPLRRSPPASLPQPAARPAPIRRSSGTPVRLNPAIGTPPPTQSSVVDNELAAIPALPTQPSPGGPTPASIWPAGSSVPEQRCPPSAPPPRSPPGKTIRATAVGRTSPPPLPVALLPAAPAAVAAPPQLPTWSAWIAWCEAHFPFADADASLVVAQNNHLEKTSMPLAHLRRWAVLWARVDATSAKAAAALWAPVNRAFAQYGATSARASLECQHVVAALSEAHLPMAYVFWSRVPPALAERLEPRDVLALLKAPPPPGPEDQQRLADMLLQASTTTSLAQHLCQAPNHPLIAHLAVAKLREAATICICRASKPPKSVVDAAHEAVLAHPQTLNSILRNNDFEGAGGALILEMIKRRTLASGGKDVSLLQSVLSRVQNMKAAPAHADRNDPSDRQAVVSAAVSEWVEGQRTVNAPLLEHLLTSLRGEELFTLFAPSADMLRLGPGCKDLATRMQAMVDRIDDCASSAQWRWSKEMVASWVNAVRAVHRLAWQAPSADEPCTAVWLAIRNRQALFPSLLAGGFVTAAAQLGELLFSLALRRTMLTESQGLPSIASDDQAERSGALSTNPRDDAAFCTQLFQAELSCSPLIARLAEHQSLSATARRALVRHKVKLALSSEIRCAMLTLGGALECGPSVRANGHRFEVGELLAMLDSSSAAPPDPGHKLMTRQFRAMQRWALSLSARSFVRLHDELEANATRAARGPIEPIEREGAEQLCALLHARHGAMPLSCSEEPLLDSLTLLRIRPPLAAVFAEYVRKQLAAAKLHPLPPVGLTPCAWLACQTLPPAEALSLAQDLLAALGLAANLRSGAPLAEQPWSLSAAARATLVGIFAPALIHAASEDDIEPLVWMNVQARASDDVPAWAQSAVYRAQWASPALTPASILAAQTIAWTRVTDPTPVELEWFFITAMTALNPYEDDFVTGGEAAHTPHAMEHLLRWLARAETNTPPSLLAAWRGFVQNDPLWTLSRAERLANKTPSLVPRSQVHRERVEHALQHLGFPSAQDEPPRPEDVAQVQALLLQAQFSTAYDAVFRSEGEDRMQARLEDLASWSLLAERLVSLAVVDAAQWWHLLEGETAREATWAAVEVASPTRSVFCKVMLATLNASVGFDAGEQRRALAVIDAMVLHGMWDEATTPTDVESLQVWLTSIPVPRRNRR